MIVVDASVLANVVADDTEDGDTARARLSGESVLHAPYLVDAEVMSVLRRRALGGDLAERRAGQALDDLEALRVVRYPHLPSARRVWELRENVTAYDALYVALAEALDCRLVTADARLARAQGPHCRIELLRSG